MLSLPVLGLLLARRRRPPSSMLLHSASWWSAWWRRRRHVTTGTWCCLHGRRRRGWNISLSRTLHIGRIIMVGCRHSPWCSRCSSSVAILVLSCLLVLHYSRIRICLSARSQTWIGKVVLGVQQIAGVCVSSRYSQVALAGERSRWSVQVFAPVVSSAPIACRSLSRARAHI